MTSTEAPRRRSFAWQALPPAPPLLRAALAACRRHLGYVILFSAALNLLYLAPSLYMLQVYDRVLVTGGLLTLLFLSLVLLGALGALALLDATRTRLMGAAARRLERLLAPTILALPFQTPPSIGARPAPIIRELDTLLAALTGPAILALVDAPWAPLYILICFIIHPWLGVLVLAGGVALVALAITNEVRLRRAMRGQEGAAAHYAVQLGDMAHAPTARALGMQKTLIDRQLAARGDASDAQKEAVTLASGFTATTKFVRLAMQSATLGFGAYLAVLQEISAGAVIAGSILSSRAFAPLEQVAAAWRQFGQALQSYRAVCLGLAEAQTERSYTRLPQARGALSVEDVFIKAPESERLIIRRVSFAVQPGEIVGVIGPSGSGKSVLTRAIVGGLAVGGGAIRIDGASLADWDPHALGRAIGYMPQDVGLFAGTVAQNIARFDPQDETGETDRAIIAAAESAGVHELILRLPRAYETPIGPDGRGLSAGQAQRVALARALYGDPALIVLDEPNAHLDAEGEDALIEALKKAQARGAAILVVAHRAGLLMAVASKFLALKEGQIVAFGSRDQVAARPGSDQGGRR
jgi:ATP-binding cassette subfamily C protein